MSDNTDRLAREAAWAADNNRRMREANETPRPHHYMNEDGFCHVGDAFEAGAGFTTLYTEEAMADLRMQYEASQAALTECLTENRENRQAADYRLGLLRNVVSFVDSNGADLPLTLLESIRVELTRAINGGAS